MAFCTEIVCDACGICITQNQLRTKGQMIHIARQEGWSIGNTIYALNAEKESGF